MGGIKVYTRKWTNQLILPLWVKFNPMNRGQRHLGLHGVGFTVITKDNTSLKLF